MRKQPAIWVSGPAGCGKTTLVNSYLEARRIPCLWYEVDEGDSDLATFFYYLGQAAKRATPRKKIFLPLLTPEYLQDIPTFTKRYFEKLYERLQIPSVVVFDNYHEVSTESPFHEAILKGLSNLPPGVNAILISRSAPPSVFTRLRANHLMEILAWKELRLTVEESAGIVKLRSKQKFSKETIAQLHKAADGWAAGLVLMLQRSQVEDIEIQKAGKVSPEEIFDYFASEIFDRTDKEVQEFLLKTSILPRMTSRMAEELTGLSSASRLLSMLSRNNYFTEKRFHSEPIYQYHPLFRDFLLSRAKDTFPRESLLVLFRRAASLLDDDGQIEAAVSLLREASDWEGMIRLIMKHAPLMVEQGRSRPLEEWLNCLPKEVMENNPWLLFWMGICNLSFSPPQSQPYFEEAYQRFKSQGDTVGIIHACWGMVYSIGIMAADYGPLDRWISVLEELGRTCKKFPSEEIELRFASAMFSALICRQPQHPEIETWANRAVSLAEGSLDPTLKFQTISTEAAYRISIGDWAKSLLVMNFLKKMAQSKESSPLNQILLAVLEAYYNNLAGLPEKCLKAVSNALELSQTTGIHTFDNAVLYQGVSSALMISDYKMASNFLEQMGSSLSRARPWDVALYHSIKTEEAMFRGDVEQAAHHIELATKMRLEIGFAPITGRCHLQNAYVMHAQGRHREASEYLAHAVDFGRSVRGPNNEYAAMLAESLFAFDQGEEESGLALLRKSFALGKERGYFGTWGPLPCGMAKLCIKALQAGIEVEYTQELIRRLHIAPDKSAIHLENWPWYLKVFTLGRFELLKDGKPIQFSRKIQQKPLSLLKALIALGGREVKEEQIADFLWPEADGDAAHNAFLSALHRLRQLVGYEKALHLREGKLTMDNRYFWVDAWALERIWKQADAQRKEGQIDIAVQMNEKAIEMYRGHFLSGESEQPWMVSLRERLRSKYLSCVNRLGQHWLQVGNGEKAIECYQRGLDADDLAEEFYQGLMTCYQRLNRETEARAVYYRCRKALSSALGIEPSAKTVAIYESIIKKDNVHGQMARANQRLN
jgi:ATP/maltotriose-dependent transcriptional regulator MalT/DNA-binding SARP family transcriptional activator